jgi:hydrogenase/urease accessory protein HupE
LRSSSSEQAARGLLLGVSTLVAMLVVTRTAGAHVLGLSRGDYTPDGAVVHVDLVMRADEAPSAVRASFLEALTVTADGDPCTGILDDTSLDPPDGIRLRATYTCPHALSHLHLRFGFLERMPADHRHLATVHLPKGDVDVLAVLARPDVDLDVSGGASHGFASLFRGGVEHILTGADHLAFLLALVLGGTLVADKRTRIGALVAMLTAFTVGHSAALAIATLGGFAPGSRWIEPAVALSVAYVGAENLFTRSVRHRWMLTLPFGFIHGFAFAGGLLPLGLPRAQLPAALCAFNLGVEGGQLLVLALLLPPLTYLASRAWYPRLARGLSVGIVLAGLLWFVQRVA